jgi:ESCRT-II complex subunit VPS36
MRIFPSGLSVLHTPPYTHASFAARLSRSLALGGPKTTMDVARDENMTVALAAEMIHAVENEGDVCRDDGMNGGSGAAVEIKWWPNTFKGYEWDGHKNV